MESNGLLGTALAEIGREGRTGCLAVTTPRGRSAVWVRDGFVIAARRCLEAPRLGIRLAALGVVPAAAVAHADEVARHDLPTWRLGELLVYLGYAEPEAITPHIRELLYDDVTVLCGVALGTSFRSGKVRSDVYPLTAIDELAGAIHSRRTEWTRLAETVGSPAGTLRVVGTPPSSPEVRAIVAAIPHSGRIDDVARATGLTLLEVARLAVRMRAAGTLDIAVMAGATPYPEPIPAPAAADRKPAAEPFEHQPPAHEPPTDEPSTDEQFAHEPSQPDPEPEPPTPRPEPDPEPAPEAVAPPAAAPLDLGEEQTDLAALMRELSALGSDQAAPAGPVRGADAGVAGAGTGQGTAYDKSKKRGFFGR